MATKKEKKAEMVSKKLQKQIIQRITGKKIPVHRYYGNRVKFGVVSDTHIGSQLLFHSDSLQAETTQNEVCIYLPRNGRSGEREARVVQASGKSFRGQEM